MESKLSPLAGVGIFARITTSAALVTQQALGLVIRLVEVAGWRRLLLHVTVEGEIV